MRARGGSAGRRGVAERRGQRACVGAASGRGRTPATWPTTTEMSLHGPHHVAQKSTSTGMGDWSVGGARRRQRSAQRASEGPRGALQLGAQQAACSVPSRRRGRRVRGAGAARGGGGAHAARGARCAVARNAQYRVRIRAVPWPAPDGTPRAGGGAGSSLGCGRALRTSASNVASVTVTTPAAATVAPPRAERPAERRTPAAGADTRSGAAAAARRADSGAAARDEARTDTAGIGAPACRARDGAHAAATPSVTLLLHNAIRTAERLWRAGGARPPASRQPMTRGRHDARRSPKLLAAYRDAAGGAGSGAARGALLPVLGAGDAPSLGAVRAAAAALPPRLAAAPAGRSARQAQRVPVRAAAAHRVPPRLRTRMLTQLRDLPSATAPPPRAARAPPATAATSASPVRAHRRRFIPPVHAALTESRIPPAVPLYVAQTAT